MKKFQLPLLALIFNFSFCVFAADEINLRKTYSRGDDDLAYVYRTAYLRLNLALKKVGQEYDARVTFLADLSTEEAQGFAESVRFGMRESVRHFRSFSDESWRSVETGQPVLFKFVRVTDRGLVADNQTQALADQLSSQAAANGGGVPGNRKEALNKTLGGTLSLGSLSEGHHSGTIFVQQLAGQQPSQTDSDISVRHLIKWYVTVRDGQVVVDFRQNRLASSGATISIAAPSWDGSVRPHRVTQLSEDAIIDGKTYATTNASFGTAHEGKASVLQRMDSAEYKREFNRQERRDIRRGRGGYSRN